MGRMAGQDERDEEAEQQLLHRYLGREAAQAVTAGRLHPDAIGSVQPCCVLFADIRHFSLLTEQVSVTMLRRLLSDFFQLFVASIEEQGGEVNKFLGDGALALFTPSSAPAAMAAVTAALQLHAQFQQLRNQWMELAGAHAQASATGQLVEVDLSVGISHGNIFVGSIGRGKRLDYTAIGSAVNIAQRLAADANAGGVYCCGRVRKQLDGSIQSRALGCGQPRGMTTELALFQLVAKS